MHSDTLNLLSSTIKKLKGGKLKFKGDENNNLTVARSSSSHADPGLRVAFKCLNV